MLKRGNSVANCADINALFVGLSGHPGLPARTSTASRRPSRFGYRSLGATPDHHRRAALPRRGLAHRLRWVAMDPADVRKVVLEEPPGNLALADTKVGAARKALFGPWERYFGSPTTTANDVTLPGANGRKVGFLMYPQAETAAERLDCLDPDRFRYQDHRQGVERSVTMPASTVNGS